VLDGELVVLDPNGATSFRKLQEALSAGRSGGFIYYVFDVPHLDGYDLSRVPQRARKQAVAGLLAASGFDSESLVRYSDHLDGHGPEFHAQACQLGLEGIIAKRADAPYRAGRGRAWLKVKCTLHEEFVVCGFTDPAGGRKGFGSLLLAGHENGRLVYAGRVGTGFSDRLLEQLHRQLRAIETDRIPLDGKPPSLKGVHWVEPRLVAEVEFTERTRDGHLRHPTFRGLREDKEAEEVAMPGIADMDEPAPAPARASVRRAPGEAEVAGVRISNPGRVMYPEAGITKLDIAQYYADIADWVLPGMADRPLTLVRCPEGWQGECFFQKHLGRSQAKGVPRVGFRESSGVKEYCYVRSAADIVALVQAGVLEIHPFGCRVGDLERPDLMVFDLDPSPDVPWSEMLRVTRSLRARIEGLGLAAFLRTTGGKGLHIVVPLKPRADWDTVKRFSQRVSELEAQADPKRLTTNMAKAKRRGRIFIDYLRNGRGATAIASYSLRAREGAPLAVPVRWDELSGLAPGRYTLQNVRRRLSALKDDPWAGFGEAARPLDAALQRAVGMKG
jgi:bifunctional non-homologous end joining protein LigD